MKIKKEVFTKNLTFKYLSIILVFLVVGTIAQLKPTKVSDITVQLSLFAMEKGYQGVVRMNSGERVYTVIDYLKKIVSSPKNLNNISIKSLETIYIEIPFDEQVKLNSEIAKSLSFKQSNERDDLNIFFMN